MKPLLTIASLWASCVFGLFPASVAAQPERPKVGLALSGGGAKGVAHIGVLRVLEEMNIPIDYIAGTSMGAIVGGLYASGMSVDELEREVEAIDWDDVLDDRPERRDLAFRRKQDTSLFLVPLEVGLGRGGLKWPSGLIQGQKLYFLLQSLTLPVGHVQDFSRLPIPFRCVATDIRNGEMVVLEKGHLATALRASMAIPTVFAPVEVDGRRLVDGGITRNLPVDVVRDMGADVVIAVDVGQALSEAEVDSMLQIYFQTMSMLTRFNVEEQLQSADLVVNPPVGSFGTMDFSRVDEIVLAGEETARAQEMELAPFAVTPAEYDLLIASRPVPRVPPERIGELVFEGNERIDSRRIPPLLRISPGDPLDLGKVGEDLQRIYGLDSFQSATFSLEKDGTSLTETAGDSPDQATEADLIYHLEEKAWGPNYLNFTISLITNFEGDSDFQILSSLTSRPVNSRGGEWRNSLLFGRDSGVASSFYQPLDFKGRWFVEPRISWENRRPAFYVDLRRVAELDVKLGIAALDLGYQFGKFGEIRVGVLRESGNVSVESGELPPEEGDQLLTDDIDVGGVEVRATIDRVDSALFPRQGYTVLLNGLLSYEGLGASLEYYRWQARVNKFITFGSHHTIFGALDGGWSPGGELPTHEEFTLGGFFSLSGFDQDQLRGQSYGVARLGYFTDIWGFFVGAYGEAGNVWQSSDEAAFDDLIAAGTIFVGKETLIGPIYLAYGLAEGGFSSIYLVFGKTF